MSALAAALQSGDEGGVSYRGLVMGLELADGTCMLCTVGDKTVHEDVRMQALLHMYPLGRMANG